MVQGKFQQDGARAVSLPTSRIDPSPTGPSRGQRPPAGGRLDFASLIASLNPLMHIPVLGGIYSAATGERPIPAVRIFVSTLIAGPIGFAASIADSVVEEATGKTMVEQAIAAISPDAPASQPVAAQPGAAQATGPRKLFPELAEARAQPVDAAQSAAATPAQARPRSLLPPAA